VITQKTEEFRNLRASESAPSMTLLLEADMNNTERLLPNPGLFTIHDHIPTSLAEKHLRINYKNFRNVKKKN
jgi:hypothetical protein